MTPLRARRVTAGEYPYWAPEYRKAGEASFAADMFCFGLILVRLWRLRLFEEKEREWHFKAGLVDDAYCNTKSTTLHRSSCSWAHYCISRRDSRTLCSLRDVPFFVSSLELCLPV